MPKKLSVKRFLQNKPVSPEKETICRQLEKILNSPEFPATKSQKAFFEFVVTETLAGRSHEINAYAIATRVFGRKDNFDSNRDPIVSIQANNLRRALERYYLVGGQNEPVLIDIPKGTFVPIFSEKKADPKNLTDFIEKKESGRAENSWPTVLVRPFQNLSGNSEIDYMSIGLATELATELTRFQYIRVVMQNPNGHGRRLSDSGARFVINGNIRTDSTGIRIATNLIDATSQTQIWSDIYESDFSTANLLALQKRAARLAVAKIASEAGIIIKLLSLESRTKPVYDLKTYEALLKYYEFIRDVSEKTFLSANDALKLAVSRDPGCAPAWALRARLFADNYSLELFNLETPVDDALFYAKKGVSLDPASQRNRLILAYVLLFKNELDAGLAEVERSLALNPNSIMLLENIGYLMTLFGDWKRGPDLLKKAIKLNPYYDIFVHYALWVDWVRQGEYEQACLETQNFRSPALFWDPVMKASAHGLLGNLEKGKKAADALLMLKPDFSSRGKVLIRNYIKFEDIVERIIDGLNRVGLALD